MLSSAIPVDGRRQAYAEALAKAKVEEEAMAATERAREAAEAAKKLEEEVKKLSEQESRAAYLAEEAREKAEAAGIEKLQNIASAPLLNDSNALQYLNILCRVNGEILESRTSTL